MFLRAHGAAGLVEAGDRCPIWAARELIVHRGGLFEMAKAGFLQILLDLCIATGGFARHELLRLYGRNTEIEYERFSRKIVDVVFQMLDPLDESGAVRGGYPRGLVSKIRTDITIGQNDFALVQSRFQAKLSFEAVARVEQGAEVRVHRFERAEVAVQELADHFAEPGIVLRESGGRNRMAIGVQGFFQKIDLSAFAAAVDALDSDKFSRWRHVRRPV